MRGITLRLQYARTEADSRRWPRRTPAGDHAFLLQARDAGDHGGARQLELARQGGDRRARVRLQQREQVAVGGVEFGIHAKRRN
jgi:hypothetical protein